VHLTDKAIRDLAAPKRGNRVAYDDAVKGFGIRVTAAGARAFVLNYRRKADGRERRITIGSFPDWGTTAAREEAKRLKRDVDAGADPIGELEQNRAAPTVRDLADRFLADYVPRKRASTQRDYKRQIAVNILPEIGDLNSPTSIGCIVPSASAPLLRPTVPSRRCRACSRWRSSGTCAPIIPQRASSAIRKASGNAI
jgi:hypothetical protein